MGRMLQCIYIYIYTYYKQKLKSVVTMRNQKRQVAQQSLQANQSTPPICLKWNWQFCQSSSCSYICIECHGEHKEKVCSQCAKGRFSPNQAKEARGRTRFATGEASSAVPTLHAIIAHNTTNNSCLWRIQ